MEEEAQDRSASKLRRPVGQAEREVFLGSESSPGQYPPWEALRAGPVCLGLNLRGAGRVWSRLLAVWKRLDRNNCSHLGDESPRGHFSPLGSILGEMPVDSLVDGTSKGRFLW